MMGRPELATDPRFATPAARREHWAELHPIICKWLDGFKTTEQAVAALTAARLPAAPVLSPAEVIAHPHLADRRAFPAIAHSGRGSVRITAVPFHVDHGPVAPRGPAPYRVGEHTREVLGEVLGYSADRIEELRRLGAIEVAS
jgi:crotonobetainyl-CoA:carnitine CoA-transferase CaiB-like acyl-CoA transferase